MIKLTTMEEVKAFSDPFRYKILMCFYRKKQPATVKEIAVALKEVPANVHYHVKKLEKVGILKLVYTKEINNIIAKYYEPTAETFNIDCPNELAEPSKQLILAEGKQLLAQIYEDSKSVFLEHMKPGKKSVGTISMEDLYLTEEEATEFQEYVVNFMLKHRAKPVEVENIKNYHSFFSIIEIK